CHLLIIASIHLHICTSAYPHISFMFRNIHHFFLQMIPGLTTEAWQAFEDCLQVKQYSRGEELSSTERVSNIISFIEQGAVMAFNVVDGKKHIYNFFFEQEYVSDYESFLTRQPAKYG